jgi:DNA polymerase III subunit epsilon
MTTNHQPTTNGQQPIPHYSEWGQVPAHLKTRTALHALRLKPAPGQRPAARKTGGFGPFDLYDIEQTVPRRAPTAAQLQALEKARAAREQAGYDRLFGRRCEGCGKWQYDRLCIDCHRQAADEAATARRNDRTDASQWAAALIAGGDFVVLDTETTGLEWNAQVVQIAVVDPEGNALMETLIRPTCAIGAGAQAIHGITAEQVASAPTLAEMWPTLYAILRRAAAIIIYNAAFDLARLNASLAPYALALPEAITARCQCAMLRYAAWYGDWSDYHGNYRWQRLPGGDHSAAGDARATLALIHTMANVQKGATDHAETAQHPQALRGVADHQPQVPALRRSLQRGGTETLYPDDPEKLAAHPPQPPRLQSGRAPGA